MSRISFTVSDEQFQVMRAYARDKGFYYVSVLCKYAFLQRLRQVENAATRKIAQGDSSNVQVHILRSDRPRETSNPTICEIKEKMEIPGRFSPRCGVSTHVTLSSVPKRCSRITESRKGIELAGIAIESCYYCGMPATEREHVIPSAILKSLSDVGIEKLIARRKLLVGACRECNELLGSSYQTSLLERKAFLKSKLRERYHSVLEMKDWTEEELAQLGRTLRSHVKAAMRLKKLLRWRLAW